MATPIDKFKNLKHRCMLYLVPLHNRWISLLVIHNTHLSRTSSDHHARRRSSNSGHEIPLISRYRIDLSTSAALAYRAELAMDKKADGYIHSPVRK